MIGSHVCVTRPLILSRISRTDASCVCVDVTFRLMFCVFGGSSGGDWTFLNHKFQRTAYIPTWISMWYVSPIPFVDLNQKEKKTLNSVCVMFGKVHTLADMIWHGNCEINMTYVAFKIIQMKNETKRQNGFSRSIFSGHEQFCTACTSRQQIEWEIKNQTNGAAGYTFSWKKTAIFVPLTNNIKTHRRWCDPMRCGAMVRKSRTRQHIITLCCSHRCVELWLLFQLLIFLRLFGAVNKMLFIWFYCVFLSTRRDTIETII